MFQYPVNRFNGFPLLALEAVVVFVLAGESKESPGRGPAGCGGLSGYKSRMREEDQRIRDKVVRGEHRGHKHRSPIKESMDNLSRLDQLWEEASAEKKRLIIVSIFPEKLTFDGKRFQTTRL